MNTLLSVRTNILYAKKDKKDESEKEEFVKFNELIFLVDKPRYQQTNGGDIVRERAVEELRFTVSQKAFDELIKVMVKLKDADESDLQ